MKLTRTFKFSPALMSVIPLVNVLFLLVIFFAMSSRFVLQPGLAVTLPASPFTLGPQHDAQLVTILSTPTPAIYHRNQKITPAELGERLGDPHIKVRSLIIRADRETPYKFLMEIMNQGLQHGFSIVLAASPTSSS